MSKHWNPGCAMKNCMTVICKHADGALPELRHFKEEKDVNFYRFSSCDCNTI